MNAKILPASLAVAVGAIGFLIGRNSQSSADSSKEMNPAALSSSARGAAADGVNDGDGRRVSSSIRAGKDSASSSSAKLDPISRYATFKNIGDPLERTRLWLQLIDSLAPEQFEDFVAAFRANGIPPELMGDYAMLLTAWAKVDPLAALDYAGKNTANPFARQTILASWAALDPNGAIAWAKSNHTGEAANPWMVGVIKGLASQDPDLASSLTKEMPRSVERGEALDALLPSLLQQKGIAGAREWVESLTDPSLKSGAMTRIADRTISTDPQGTADWLIANPSEATSRRLDDALFAMARKDSSEALNYLNKLPQGDDRTNALRGIINATASQDPKQAVALLDRFSGDVSNRVVENFVWHSFRQDPQTAVSNISRITNDEDQLRMYNRTLSWWMERDQQAAIDWVNSNTVPQSVVNRLNSSLEQKQ